MVSRKLNVLVRVEQKRYIHETWSMHIYEETVSSLAKHSMKNGRAVGLLKNPPSTRDKNNQGKNRDDTHL